MLLVFLLILLLFIGAFMFMLTRFLQSEKDRRNFELRLKYSENIVPHKLQAYERMTLFLERIRPSSLIRRVNPTEDIKSYEFTLIETIQTEFEHNLAQQLYISPNSWKIILSAKNATQLLIKNTIEAKKESSIKEIQEEIIKQSMEDASPSSTAILYLQKDIQNGI
ncbi:hypothetical protein Ga0061079_104101 [Apibacter mensalis]|uniref:Uncharacterized protein n=2 Tax=Apibacter mensalis TaxID=1586267 RepID=A0A0X3AP18_9FLAO|nr:hypothetical protein Ga0061079_104101 [Apibacter mensalis]